VVWHWLCSGGTYDMDEVSVTLLWVTVTSVGV